MGRGLGQGHGEGAGTRHRGGRAAWPGTLGTSLGHSGQSWPPLVHVGVQESQARQPSDQTRLCPAESHGVGMTSSLETFQRGGKRLPEAANPGTGLRPLEAMEAGKVNIQCFSALKLEAHCLLGGVGGLWDSGQVELGLVGCVGVHQYKTEEDGTG